MPETIDKASEQKRRNQALWERVLEDPDLRDLPYKVETNEYGQIVLSPVKNKHSFLQERIADLLRERIDRPGRLPYEFAVDTADGVKVPDVVWISEERRRRIPEDAASSPMMPEICVEVLSDSNTEYEIGEKRQLYLNSGAEEVWVVRTDGTVRFFDASGEREASALATDFPKRVDV